MIDARWMTLLAVAVCGGGCATAIRGTTQVIAVTSTPPGAECRFLREGVDAGVVAATPGRLMISRSATDVVVVCRKDQHYEGRALLIAGNRESLFVEALRDNAADPSSRQGETTGTAQGGTTAEVTAAVAGGAVVTGAAVGVPALVGAGLAGSTAAAGAAIALAPVALVAAPIALVVDASSGTYFAYPRAVSVTLLPIQFADVEARDAAIARALVALDDDDDALRRRFDATCGFTCRRAKPVFEAFLSGRRVDLLRVRDTASLTAR